jgi:hypothetical protein
VALLVVALLAVLPDPSRAVPTKAHHHQHMSG